MAQLLAHAGAERLRALEGRETCQGFHHRDVLETVPNCCNVYCYACFAERARRNNLSVFGFSDRTHSPVYRLIYRHRYGDGAKHAG